jgi:hypothetical protein
MVNPLEPFQKFEGIHFFYVQKTCGFLHIKKVIFEFLERFLEASFALQLYQFSTRRAGKIQGIFWLIWDQWSTKNEHCHNNRRRHDGICPVLAVER